MRTGYILTASAIIVPRQKTADDLHHQQAPSLSGERCSTMKTWQLPSSIESSNVDALSTSTDPPVALVI